jgi:hypothetical protein
VPVDGYQSKFAEHVREAHLISIVTLAILEFTLRKSDTVDGDTHVPPGASAISSTRRTETPARYISLRMQNFETAFIERYRWRESSVEEALITSRGAIGRLKASKFTWTASCSSAAGRRGSQRITAGSDRVNGEGRPRAYYRAVGQPRVQERGVEAQR